MFLLLLLFILKVYDTNVWQIIVGLKRVKNKTRKLSLPAITQFLDAQADRLTAVKKVAACQTMFCSFFTKQWYKSEEKVEFHAHSISLEVPLAIGNNLTASYLFEHDNHIIMTQATPIPVFFQKCISLKTWPTFPNGTSTGTQLNSIYLPYEAAHGLPWAWFQKKKNAISTHLPQEVQVPIDRFSAILA